MSLQVVSFPALLLSPPSRARLRRSPEVRDLDATLLCIRWMSEDGAVAPDEDIPQLVEAPLGRDDLKKGVIIFILFPSPWKTCKTVRALCCEMDFEGILPKKRKSVRFLRFSQ